MRVCGIKIEGSEALLAIVENDDEGGTKFVPCATKKIVLKDDKSSESLRAFTAAIKSFIDENSIEVICIKGRASRGKYAGGPVSFKIEALIQVSTEVEINFVTAQTLSRFKKGNYSGVPEGIAKYLHEPFSCAAYILEKE